MHSFNRDCCLYLGKPVKGAVYLAKCRRNGAVCCPEYTVCCRVPISGVRQSIARRVVVRVIRTSPNRLARHLGHPAKQSDSAMANVVDQSYKRQSRVLLAWLI